MFAESIGKFEEIENAGTQITYRCIDCRNFPECKRSPRLEDINIQEEVEQSLIYRSVHLDFNKSSTTASLPFLTEHDLKLVPNEHSAAKVHPMVCRMELKFTLGLGFDASHTSPGGVVLTVYSQKGLIA